MIFFQKHKFFIATVALLVVAAISFTVYYGYVQVQEEKIRHTEYTKTAQQIQKKVANAIVLKEKATLAIALALANQKDFQYRVLQKTIPAHYFDSIIKQFRQNTLYKNIWIQVLDKNGKSLYKSWTKKHGENRTKLREEIATIQRKKKILNIVSVGQYDLSIKGMIPIMSGRRMLGIFEVISHFNSIAKNFKEDGFESVVLATKEQSKHIKYPFTKLFIGEYYVANLNAAKNLRDLLGKYGVENIVKKPYSIINGYFIVPYSIKNSNKKVIGYDFIFQKLSALSNRELEHFTFKWMILGLVLFSLLGALINTTLYLFMRKQKIYYKNIIDTSKNIIIINDKKKILEVNKTFFKYFKNYKTLDAFREQNGCVCKFFLEEEGYLDQGEVSYYWLDMVLKNSETTNKVKMNIDNEIYYFSVTAALIDPEKGYYSVVFSDITQEEIYKNELQKSVITDPLTGLYNRRYYYEKIKEEMYAAKRYGLALSIIMTDIDFFKKVNDTHGHDVGDEVLKIYSKLLQESLRESDIICRIGGEEFIILLPHTDKEHAFKIAEKLRKLVQKSKKILPITMSFGVTEYINGESEDYIFKRVDEALYKAKEQGRNRVEIG